MKRVPAFAAAALTLCAAHAHAQTLAQAPLAFVTCPMLRDTATVPCWLAEHEGELYYLGAQGDFAAGVSPPSLGHQALIEGMASGERRCGGKVLTDLHVSIRPEREGACDAILPATEAFQITARPQDAATVSAGSGASPAAETPERVGSQKFEVLYDFDWQTTGRYNDVIQEAAAYAKANPQAEVHVVGYRAAVQLAGGKVLEEVAGIDLWRATGLVDTLTKLGVENMMLAVDNPAPEIGDFTRRRAVIEVTMSGSDDHSEH